jgi:hypothetical protein
MEGKSSEAPIPPMTAQKMMMAVSDCARVMAVAPMA